MTTFVYFGRVRALLLLAALSLLLTGCGGAPHAVSSRSVKTGGLKFSVRWPSRSRSLTRLIPAGSNSILVTVVAVSNGQQIGTTLLARPLPPGTAPADPTSTTTATINSLPTGDVRVVALAYPNADGTGHVQASGALTATVIGQQVTTTPPLTMNSTIDHIVISPDPINAAPNGAVTVVASALDAVGAVVLVDASKFSFVVANTAIATADAQTNPSQTQTGVAIVTGHAIGTTSLVVADAESGKTATAQIVINTPLNIIIADVGNKRLVGLDTVPATASATYDDSVSGSPFYSVANVALDSQRRIYIADGNGRFIRVDDFTGANRVTYSPPSIQGIIHVDRAGHIYYREAIGTLHRVDDMNGTNLLSYGSGVGPGNIGNVSGIATDSLNRIYLFDGDSRVIRIDDMTGANRVDFGTRGSGVNQFRGNYSNGLAIDSQDRIYVADAGNARLVRFDDMAGANWTTFAVPAGANTPTPVGIAVSSGPSPQIYFTDRSNALVYRMDDMNGTNLVSYGGQGTGTGQFQFPNGIAVK